GREPRLAIQRHDRGPARDHRDGAAVHRRADPAERRASRSRGLLPRGHRRADDGARTLRDHDSRGVRRSRARPHDLHDDRGGARPGLGLDLRRHQHPFHRHLSPAEVRHRRTEAEVPSEDGHGRAAGGVLDVRAGTRLRRPGDQDERHQAGRRLLRDQRPEDVGHQRPDERAGLRAGQDRPRGREAPQRHDVLHRREGARRRREHRGLPGPERPAEAQEDGLQGRGVDRAGLRRLPLPGRERPRGGGGRSEQGIRADDGRPRGRPGQRRRARRRDRPARARARPALLPGAQGLRQADRRAPGHPVQARRHGHPGRRRPPADAARRPHEGQRRALRPRGGHGQALRLRGRPLLRRGVLPHPRGLRLLQGVRDRAPLPRCAPAADRRGHLGDPADGHRQEASAAPQDL
ncbi:MAG: Acyl-CoA dehydrogenase, partial [uncultured Solirubrobacteraceae bacterium]